MRPSYLDASSSPSFQDVPPEIAAVLPANILQQMRAVHRNTQLTDHQKMDAIHKIMDSLPQSVRDRIPRPPGPPPGFAGGVPPGFADVLPPDALQKIKAIHSNNQLSHEQKREATDRIIATLPDYVLDKLPKPPGHDRLPKKTRDQLRKLQRDTSLTHRQRMEQMRQIFDALPANLRPPPPPPPPPSFARRS
ncbi:hypothetical protein OESDEN_08715 [Oesophagostomum dentatum]|uniref:Uncharacterized protein n=1 Tax=Oesophagostomum dentatum TaxID=61180 RepID=A0A0B1T6J0_OESDE|nr:hypothetical protein OESDEN_08715 [Oesophagostomum dentatum]